MKKYVIFILLIIAMCSCRHLSFTANSNIKNISLGMTKEQVVDIMGKHYKPIEAFETPEGFNEAIGYDAAHNEVYKLHFLNNKLKSWERVWLNQYPNPDNSGKENQSSSSGS